MRVWKAPGGGFQLVRLPNCNDYSEYVLSEVFAELEKEFIDFLLSAMPGDAGLTCHCRVHAV